VYFSAVGNGGDDVRAATLAHPLEVRSQKVWNLHNKTRHQQGDVLILCSVRGVSFVQGRISTCLSAASRGGDFA
jgi:hypothetical protein